MSTMRRCICLLLAILMIPGLVPVSALEAAAKPLPLQEETFAMVSIASEPGVVESLDNGFFHTGDTGVEGTAAVSGSCGENVTWIFDESTATLTISGTGDMEDYGVSLNAPWYDLRKQIVTVVIEPGVTSIGDYAFEYCLATSVTIPDSVTTIGEYAFYDCYKLTEIQLPDSLYDIGDGVFANSGIVEIVLPEGIEEIPSAAFYACFELKTITFPASVVRIGTAFSQCESLKDIWFLGDAPEIAWRALNTMGDGPITMHYPANNETWWIDLDDYYFGIGSVIWEAYCPDHHYESTVYPPTCTEKGYTEYRCPVCEEWYRDDYVDSLGGHDYEITVTPTGCTSYGYSTHTCRVCGDTFTEDYVLPAGHQYGEWVLEREETCTEDGLEYCVCQLCGYRLEQWCDALGHTYRQNACTRCGVDQDTLNQQIVDVTAYQYTVTPILAPYTYYLYVQTDNPDPTSFRLMDASSIYCDEDTQGKIRGRHGSNWEYTDGCVYYICQNNYADVEYEDEAIYRVAGGYIFRVTTDAYSDGGELILLQKTKCGNGSILNDQFVSTSVRISCPRLYTDLDHLIQTGTTSDMTFFAKMDALQQRLEEIAVYPQGCEDENQFDSALRYPCIFSSPYPEHFLMRGTPSHPELDDGLLLFDAYPYVLDSLGFPGMMWSAAELLDPDCQIEQGDYHWEINVTLNGETQSYGGDGAGEGKPIFEQRVQTVFHFLDETCFGIAGTLEEYRELFRQYDEVSWNDAFIYERFVDRDIYCDTIRDTGGTWIRLNGGKYAYIALSTGGYPQEASDVWVDGRYVSEKEHLILNETWEDHPETDILLENVTYTNAYGYTETGAVVYTYYAQYDSWIAYSAYRKYNIPPEDMPDILVLTRGEAEALDPDRNTHRWPESGLVYDGIEYPGTPFTHVPVASISIPAALELDEGESAILKLELLPADASDQRVYWSSADPSIVKITNSDIGEITGISEGVTVITVKTRDGALTASCTVTVHANPCKDGHSFTQYTSNEDATCTEDGTKTAKCDHCDAADTITDVGSALGHDMGNWEITVPATCTGNGQEQRICSRCDHSESRVIEAVGHSWDGGVVTKEPTEEAEGERLYTCTACGATRTERIPIVEHEHRYEAAVTAPTCTEQGYTTHTCRCGDSYVDTYVDALGHDMSEWFVVTEATCTADGMEQRDCSRCNHHETQVIEAAGHDYESVVTEPTCTEQGYTTHTCDCGDSYTDSYIDALGHSFTTYVSDSNASCAQDGTKTSVCDRCDATDTVVDEGSAYGHDFTDWTVILKPTEAAEGLESRYCLRCGVEETRVIARLENPFADVPSDSFYYEAVMWAVANGVTNGTSATTFGPNDQCMRAHVVTFLWRAVGSPEPTRTDNPFVDVKETDFYYKAVMWALENGITSGMDATHFGPTSYCNRAQVVTFLYRTMGSPEIESAENPFTDVEAGSFYEKAVLWAVENGITNGLSATAFGPNTICNRAQIVTFLYRAFVND